MGGRGHSLGKCVKVERVLLSNCPPKTETAQNQPRANSDTWRNTALHHGVWKHFPFISSPFDSRSYTHTLSSILTR